MSRWVNPFQKRHGDDDLDREIAFHIEELTQTNLKKGMSASEARRHAMIAFGGREQTKQSLREVHGSGFFENLRFNGKAAVRFVRRSPSFSAAVILILGVAIGANSAVFSAIDGVILRPLPFPKGDELVSIYQHDLQNRDANHFVAPVRLEDWNRLNSTFQTISGYYLDDLSETSGALPEKVTESLVAPRFLQVLEVAPVLGRAFSPEEERFGGPDAVLISYAFWQRRFHGDASALGKKLRIGRYSYGIVGIMPASFHFPNADVDLWAPSPPDAPYAQSRDSTWFTVIGRVKPGVRLKQAQADLAMVQSQLGKQFPKPDAALVVETTPLKNTIVDGSRHSLWLLYAAVSVLLLIACSNIAALLLARMSDREHEIAIRYSLGAPRASIVVQLLSEIAGLALCGFLCGLVAVGAVLHGLHLLSSTIPRAEEISLNWRIVLYSFGSAVLTTLLCGLFPAMHGTRRVLAHSRARSARTQVHSRNPIQWTLVGVQVTLAVTLLVGAGLLLRTLQEIGRVSPGFDPSHVLTFQVSGSWGETGDMKSLVQRIDRILDGLRTLPGARAAATSSTLPGVSGLYQVEFKLDGKLDPGRRILANSRYVSAGYFDTVQIPLLAGQLCNQDSGTNDIVVNRSFVNLYLKGEPALGHELQAAPYNDFQPSRRIRGVVGDAREEGLNAAPVPTVYSCYSAPTPFPSYLLRTQGDPLAMAEAVRRRIHELEPARSVYGVTTLQQHIDNASGDDRLRTILLSLFAGSALLLACIGLYGTLSYLGRLRQREIGVRLALGAKRGQIVASILLQGLRIASIGCVVGVIISVFGNRLIAGMLYGITPLDAETYTGVVVLILLVAAGASLIPAWRSAQAEPTEALRQQ